MTGRRMTGRHSPRLLFASAAVLVLLALYCFSGSVMKARLRLQRPPIQSASVATPSSGFGLPLQALAVP